MDEEKYIPYPPFSSFFFLIHSIKHFFGTATGLFSAIGSLLSFPRHPGWECDLRITDFSFGQESTGTELNRSKPGLFTTGGT